MNTQNYVIRPLSDEQILSIYSETAPLHFPADELRPLSNIRDLLRRGGYQGLGIFGGDPNTLMGYALFLKVPGEDTLLLDFYAILEEYRSLGLGSVFLQGMKEHYAGYAGILLETEDPESAADEADLLIRTRRNAFYYKNGVRQTGLSCTLFGVPFRILYLPLARDHSSDDASLREKLEAIYRFMVPGKDGFYFIK